MEVIPVIDLLNGQVVRAQRGERKLYRPMRSQLCDSSAPLDVACALLELYPFRSLYIADLNAIQGLGGHAGEIAALRQHFPGTEFWIDAGIRTREEWPYADDPASRCVIGSENLQSPDQLLRLVDALPPDGALLSLDFSRDGLLGPAALASAPYAWPRRVICMTLARVGSYDGPDLALLEKLSAEASGKRLYAAGGIRGIDDLHGLNRLGIAGALLASALHDGRISARQIAGLAA